MRPRITGAGEYRTVEATYASVPPGGSRAPARRFQQRPRGSSIETLAGSRPPKTGDQIDSLFRLDGKRVLVVGGYGGIGRITSQLLSEAGAVLAVAGRSFDKAEALAEELSAGGGEALGASVDLADRSSAHELVTTVVERLGGLDVLVNCAGIDIQAPAAGHQRPARGARRRRRDPSLRTGKLA